MATITGNSRGWGALRSKQDRPSNRRLYKSIPARTRRPESLTRGIVNWQSGKSWGVHESKQPQPPYLTEGSRARLQASSRIAGRNATTSTQ